MPVRKIPIFVPTSIDELLYDRTALITGGSSGIGLSIAKRLKQAGASIIILGRNIDKLRSISEDNGFDFIQADVSNVKDIEKCIKDLISKKHIPDILINSAGIGQNGDLFSITEGIWDEIIAINLKGTFFICQYISKLWIEKGIKGHILNISSSSAKKPAWGPYQISKWGIRGFTLGLAKQLLPYGIVVNALAPGKTATKMMNYTFAQDDLSLENGQPIKRYVTPDELANLALFMVSNYGNSIIGDTFYITGGNGLLEL